MLASSAKIPALRNYQLDGLLSLFVGIDTLCIFPTGSGKTLVFAGVVALYKLLYTKLGGNDSFRPLVSSCLLWLI
jgi:superfamily II DNA or RNA helicase